jgi:addiction module HigA family antidote
MSRLKPITPGELFLEEFLKPMGISQYRLAKEVGVPAQRISEIVAGKRSITADTDLRLCKFFGLSNGYWMRAQAAHDTEVAERKWVLYYYPISNRGLVLWPNRALPLTPMLAETEFRHSGKMRFMADALTKTQISHVMPKLRSRGTKSEGDRQDQDNSSITCHLGKTRIGIVNEGKKELIKQWTSPFP